MAVYKAMAHIEDNSPCIKFVPYDTEAHGSDHLYIRNITGNYCSVSNGGGYKRGRGKHFMNLAPWCFDVSGLVKIEQYFDNFHVQDINIDHSFGRIVQKTC